MNAFQTKMRRFHAKTIENIMTRNSGCFQQSPREKSVRPKPDNITTYLRKFEIERENLNLAKRILLCESEHNHKLYEQEWKKNQNFLRVRSNFKRALSNEEPRIFKFEPILGKGNCLVNVLFTKFESNYTHFKQQNVYSFEVVLKQKIIAPTSSTFLLGNLGNSPMSFYVPSFLRKKKIVCKILDVKQNKSYEKGRFNIDLSTSDEQEIQILNKQGKVIGIGSLKVEKCSKGRNDKRNKKSSEFNKLSTREYTNYTNASQDFTQNCS